MLERILAGIVAAAALFLALAAPAGTPSGYLAPTASSTAMSTDMPAPATSTPAVFDDTYPNCDTWVDAGGLIRCAATHIPYP